MKSGARYGAHRLAGALVTEIGQQLQHVVRKVFGASMIASQRDHRALVAARCATQTEVDTTRIQRLERTELLRDDEWRVVGQHDPACTDSNARCSSGDMTDHDRGCRTRDAGHVVMLGQPVPVVAELLRMPSEVERPAKCIGRVSSGEDGRQVEHGERDHQRFISSVQMSV